MNRPSYLLFKQCSKCGKILHVSRFYRHKTGKYGVERTCKKCSNERNRIYKQEHKEELLEKSKEYYNKNKDIINEKNRKRRENNIEKYREFGRKSYQNNIEKNRERSRNYHNEHKEELNKKSREWKKNNPEKILNNHNKRRDNLKNQGNGITKEQWKEMMDFFDWKCAYSGEYIGGDNKDKIRTIDHIIALDNGGEHEIWNLVPMYFNYNSSKGTKNMLEWYLEQPFFSIERLTKIYEWRIYAYWKWKDEI